MTVTPTSIPGVRVVLFERSSDERGWFQRLCCTRSFREHNLPEHWPQASVCHNEQAGTLRGLHWQAQPHGETKLISVVRGRVFDVIVDLRPDSPTFRRFQTFILDAQKPGSLLVPEYCAHGYLTLTDGVLLDYRMTSEYVPAAARTLNPRDPDLQIPWPARIDVISPRDERSPMLADLHLT